MHGYLKITSQELSALMGLPYLQQVTYLLGIRPYMDATTSLVGIKRGISYQSLAETLYVEPHQGIQSGSPSRQQLRRVIKALERAGISDVRWHDLRHTWASWHVQNGTPLHELQQLGGWSTYGMVLRYAHPSSEHLRTAAERIHDVCLPA